MGDRLFEFDRERAIALYLLKVHSFSKQPGF